MSDDNASNFYSFQQRNLISRHITNSTIQKITEVPKNKEVYSLTCYDNFNFFNKRKMIRCRGKEIYLPSIDYDFIFNIDNDNKKENIDVYLESGKSGNVATIRNLTDAHVNIYYNNFHLCNLKKDEFCLYLAYYINESLHFLPVKIEM